MIENNDLINMFWEKTDELSISVNSYALFFYLTTKDFKTDRYNISIREISANLGIYIKDLRFCIDELNRMGIINIKFDIGASTFSFSIGDIDNSLHNSVCNRVYIFNVCNSNIYKIGVSKNIYKRIKDIENSTGQNLKVIYSVRKDSAYKVERFIHESIYDKRLYGEYFTLSDDELICVINMLNKYNVQ